MIIQGQMDRGRRKASSIPRTMLIVGWHLAVDGNQHTTDSIRLTWLDAISLPTQTDSRNASFTENDGVGA